MKFRTIFISFNVIVLASFLFTFLMPALVLGPSFSAAFWARNWLLGALFALVLGGLNVFFALNWKVLALLEREDWPALSTCLHGQVMVRGRFSAARARLYANTLLLLSDLVGIKALEEKAASSKPRILDRYAALFGVARILSGDDPGAIALLSPREGKRGVDSGTWLSFYLAWARIRAGDLGEAAKGLGILAKSRDRAVRGLSAYVLSIICGQLKDSGESAAAKAAAESARTALRAKLDKKAWNRSVEAAMQDVLGVVMGKYLGEAGEWIYGEGRADL